LKLAKINEQAFRAHEMIADMMLFAHPPSPEFRQADPAVIVRQVIEELMSAGEFQSANLDVDVPESLPPIWVDPDQLAVALRAVVQNSVEATGAGGQIAIRAVADAGPWATEISVSDNGPGFPPDQLEHVFDPFYSGREAGRGLGFGLSKAWRIAQLHDGEIEAANAGHRGAIVTIRLPRPSTAA
jgi:signal transduction histidine kinase